MRPFRLLLVDDDVASTFRTSPRADLSKAPKTSGLSILGRLCTECRRDGAPPTEVYLAENLSLDSRSSVIAVHPPQKEWESRYLDELDVLILDVGLPPLLPSEQLRLSDLPPGA